MEAMLNSRQVREHCGAVSDMTLWRWLNDENSRFPAPTYVNRRRYWRASEIDMWWQSRTVAA